MICRNNYFQILLYRSKYHCF